MNPNSATTTTAIPAPQASAPQAPSLHARGLALCSTLMALLEIILTYIVDSLTGNHALPNAKVLSLLGKAIGCLFSLTRLRLTILRAPQRFTARQVLRLSRAFDKICYLTGRALDFSPWTSLTPDQIDQLSPKKSPSPSPSQSPSSGNPQSPMGSPSVPLGPQVPSNPAATAVRAATITVTPGATLARICEDMVALADALGLPRHAETGFLPTQSPSPSPSQSVMESPSPSPSPSPSQSISSSNPQSAIRNPQSPSVHPVHPVHPIHSVHNVHLGDSASPIPSPQSEISNLKSEIPSLNSLSPALRRQLTIPIRAPD